MYNGRTLWEGHSPVDGAPLALIASGFIRPSENTKTGPMIQVSLVRSDISPNRAVLLGKDDSVCNQCELRPTLVRNSGKKSAQCYVQTDKGLNHSWKAFKRGFYPFAMPSILSGLVVRFGSYGNVSNVPQSILEPLFAMVRRHTCYDHNWHMPDAQWLRRYAMASVSCPSKKQEANNLGWRTFRVVRSVGELLPDEILCPAGKITSLGKKITCYDCGLCSGTMIGAKNIAIVDHGPTSPERKSKRLSLKVVTT